MEVRDILWLQTCQPCVFLLMLHTYSCNLHFHLSPELLRLCPPYPTPHTLEDRGSSEALKLSYPISEQTRAGWQREPFIDTSSEVIPRATMEFCSTEVPKSPGLGFHFMWHTQTCPWLLQTPQASVSHPPTWTSQTRNLCLKLSTMLKHQLTVRWELSFWWFHRWLGKAIL